MRVGFKQRSPKLDNHSIGEQNFEEVKRIVIKPPTTFDGKEKDGPVQK